jgi:hypothetical protein
LNLRIKEERRGGLGFGVKGVEIFLFCGIIKALVIYIILII